MDQPPLDLSRDRDAGSACQKEIREHCEKYGFVKFTGHGIKDSMVADAMDWVNETHSMQRNIP
jgi:isopenicillin N synthase-like dioxygenase